MRQGTGFFIPLRRVIEDIRGNTLRMAKYSETPMSYFLDLPMSNYCKWIETINAEIKAEDKQAKSAREK